MLAADPNHAPHEAWITGLSFAGAAAFVALLWLGSYVRNRNRPAEPPAIAPRIASTRLEPLIFEVLREFEQSAALRLVQLEISLQEGLTALAIPAALREALALAISCAIGRAPAGSVLVSAERRGDGVEIAVLDDGISVDPDVVAAALRPAERALALQGGSLRVRPPGGSGNTVVLHLPTGDVRPASSPPWLRPPPTKPPSVDAPLDSDRVP